MIIVKREVFCRVPMHKLLRGRGHLRALAHLWLGAGGTARRSSASHLQFRVQPPDRVLRRPAATAAAAAADSAARAQPTTPYTTHAAPCTYHSKAFPTLCGRSQHKKWTKCVHNNCLFLINIISPSLKYTDYFHMKLLYFRVPGVCQSCLRSWKASYFANWLWWWPGVH